jgi:Domain of unknown function (DUF5122) beta-propeller
VGRRGNRAQRDERRVRRGPVHPGGGIDTTFGTDGVAATEMQDSSVQGAQSVLIEPGGLILLGGEALLNVRGAPAVGALARFNSNGTIDSTFGIDGRVETSTSSGIGPITALGQTVGVGKHDDEVQVEQFNAYGTLDFTSPTFHYSGAGTSGEDGASAVAVQPNGQILVGGSHFLGTSVFGLARIDVGGSLHSTFGNDGTCSRRSRATRGSPRCSSSRTGRSWRRQLGGQLHRDNRRSNRPLPGLVTPDRAPAARLRRRCSAGSCPTRGDAEGHSHPGPSGMTSVLSRTVWVPRFWLKSVPVNPGSTELMRILGNAFAYCVVSMLSAAFDEKYAGTTNAA